MTSPLRRRAVLRRLWDLPRIAVIVIGLAAAAAQAAEMPPLDPAAEARAQQLRQEIAALEKKAPDGAAELVDKRLDLVSILAIGDRYAEARRLIDATLPAVPADSAHARQRYTLLYWSAVVEYSEQRFRQALPLLEQALQLAHALDLQNDQFRVGTVLERKAYCLEALDEYAAVLPVREELLQRNAARYGADSLQAAEAHFALARTTGRLSRIDEALEHLLVVLQIYEQRLDPASPKLFQQLEATAALLSFADRPDEAEAALQRTQQRCMAAYAAAPARCNGFTLALAEHYARSGRSADSLALASQASAAARGQPAADTETEIVDALHNAQVRMRGQDFVEAEYLLQRALQLQQTARIHTQRIGVALIALADAAERQGRNAAADSALRAADAQFAAAGSDAAYGVILAGVAKGTSLLRQARAAEAETLYRSLLEPARRLDGKEDLFGIVVKGELARALAMGGKIAEADRYVAEGLQAVLRGPRLRQMSADYLHGVLLTYSADRPELAIYLGKQAVNSYQTIRGGVDANRAFALAGYTESVATKYRDLANLLLDRGRLAEAEQVLAMLKEEELFDFLRRDTNLDPRQARISFTAAEAPWARRQAELIAELDALNEKQRQLSTVPDAQRSRRHKRELARLSRKLARAQQALDSHVYEMIAALGKAPSRVIGLGDDPLVLAAIERSRRQLRELPPGTVLVHYLLLGDRLRILLSTRDGWLQRDSRIVPAALAGDISTFRRNLRDPAQDPRPAAQRLYRLLLAPIAADLNRAGARMLMFSLDGILRYIPMAALHDGDQWLAERYASTLFTAAARDRLTQAPQTGWRAAGFGVREGGSFDGWQFAALPAVERELRAVVRSRDDAPDAIGVLPGIRLLDAAFTRESLASAIQQGYPVLHVASHFHFDAAAAAQSFLLLGGGGKLSLDELGSGAGYDLSKVDLITLSACETALESPGADGREVEGLGTLAQRRGARSVLATLWPVADVSSADFMHTLYSLQQRPGTTKAQALQMTQQQFIAATGGAGDADAAAARTADDTPAWSGALLAHPYFWSGYILMGNWL